MKSSPSPSSCPVKALREAARTPWSALFRDGPATAFCLGPIRELLLGVGIGAVDRSVPRLVAAGIVFALLMLSRPVLKGVPLALGLPFWMISKFLQAVMTYTLFLGIFLQLCFQASETAGLCS